MERRRRHGGFTRETIRNLRTVRARIKVTFSHPFLLIVQVWLGILFLSWGLFAPRNAIVIGAMFLCAATIAITVMITEDFDRPFEGIVTVSPKPIEDALTRIGAS